MIPIRESRESIQFVALTQNSKCYKTELQSTSASRISLDREILREGILETAEKWGETNTGVSSLRAAEEKIYIFSSFFAR